MASLKGIKELYDFKIKTSSQMERNGKNFRSWRDYRIFRENTGLFTRTIRSSSVKLLVATEIAV